LRTDESRRLWKYTLWILTIVVIVIYSFLAIQTTYTTRAIAHYQQLLTLVGPFLDEPRVKKFNSRFAQVRSSSDYVAVIADLRAIAQQHGLKPPDFRPW